MYSIQTTTGQTFEWHLNDQKPDITVDSVVSIQADGDELISLGNLFMNLPMMHGICIWRGEMARFIFENLGNYIFR